ncbi:hypothetical protein [Hallella bergensis]|uniref:hypothetical protein n=1 Tax=Hallella bergensis TaxID=242750 RepID=UPI0039906992
MAKKTYVSPSMMLLTAGDPGGEFVPFSKEDHSGELAKPGYFDELEDLENSESPW